MLSAEFWWSSTPGAGRGCGSFRLGRRGGNMKRAMKREYDFSRGKRGPVLNIGICDFEVIGFIFAHFLDGRARSRSLNDEMWFVEACLAPKRDAGFLGKPVQESLPRSFQPRFLVPFQSDAKMPVNNEFPLAAHNMRGKRHDRQRLVLSRAKIACGDNPAKRKQ